MKKTQLALVFAILITVLSFVSCKKDTGTDLFEKIKIPECRENIRVIRIALGNNDTAGVARSKIAKRKSQEAAA